jgi:hypothetical protein
MPIKFTKHALERMKNRNISKEEVIETLTNPDSEKKDSYGNKIAQKLNGDYYTSVFYKTMGKDSIIITI